MSMRRSGQHPDELISAAISGDISEREQAQLDTHLATCESCRQTMAAWTEQRRMVAGMRQAPVPRDLGPRIRAGIESGAFTVPWWHRTGLLVGGVAGLATVAAALVAVAVISGLLPKNQTASTGSPMATASASAASIVPTSIPSETSAPSTPEPSALPVAMKHPASWLRYQLTDQRPKLELATPGEGTPIDVGEASFPIDASLSPGGDWVAFRLQGDASGLVSTYAFRQSDGALVVLGHPGAYSPFARFAWSPQGDLLAYTATDEAGNADVWLMNAGADRPAKTRLTDTGRSFVASFTSESALWVSSAAEGDPATYLIDLDTSGLRQSAGDPASVADTTLQGVFLPVGNRQGPGTTIPADAVVYWRGQMALDGMGWHFARGGMLYWHGPDGSGQVGPPDASDPQVFDSLQIQPGGAAFESARFEWAPDGDGLAVWDTMWTGTAEGNGFPDQSRVYFAHLDAGLKIGAAQALDKPDTEGLRVVDVSLGGAQYLGLTVVTDSGSEGGAFGPTAELRLVTRNTGNVPDEVETIGQDRVWNGPALYPAVVRSGDRG